MGPVAPAERDNECVCERERDRERARASERERAREREKTYGGVHGGFPNVMPHIACRVILPS